MGWLAVIATLVAGCAGGEIADGGGAADLGGVDACPAPAFDGGAGCDGSADCPRTEGCFGGTCRPIAACAADCGCPAGRSCTDGVCRPASGMPCGPCDTACTAAGGTCRSGGCATRCDDTRTFCPRGDYCDIAPGASRGVCVSTLGAGCRGCTDDTDCPSGEVCNPNSRACVPRPTGPDARLDLTAVDFLYDDGSGNPTRSRSLTTSLGFFSSPDPSFDPYALAPGECARQRSSLDENAPFPLGPMRDAGDPLTLTLASRAIAFARMSDPNPGFGFDYIPDAFTVADFVPGAATWAGPGGADVGSLSAPVTAPTDFTTTPDLLGPAVAASLAAGVSLRFGDPTPPDVGSWLEVSWNDVAGGVVTALTRIACRGAAGADIIEVPPAMLADVPQGAALGLTATRASVHDFTARGVALGRAVLALQAAGSVVFSP